VRVCRVSALHAVHALPKRGYLTRKHLLDAGVELVRRQSAGVRGGPPMLDAIE